jgi:hypothetical protein
MSCRLTGLRDGKPVTIELFDLGLVGGRYVSEFVVDGKSLGMNGVPGVKQGRRWRIDLCERLAKDEEFLEQHGITEVRDV